MHYQVIVYDHYGHQIESLGKFGNIASARQAMLDHSNTIDLPTEEPFHCPGSGVLEGWFIDRTEYNITV